MKRCPFCGSRGRVSIRELEYFGQNEFGSKKIKFASQVICNKCHARGGLAVAIIITAVVGSAEEFGNLRERAIELWNNRKEKE